MVDGWVVVQGSFTWSGAKNPDHLISHLLYVYTSLVVAGPTIPFAFLWTLLLPSYRYGLIVNRKYFLVLLIFHFWSILTSYVGVITLFELQRWKARIWFLAFPLDFYV